MNVLFTQTLLKSRVPSRHLLFLISIMLTTQGIGLGQSPPTPQGQFFPTEWNSVMVESTYEISQLSPGGPTSGTAFILGVADIEKAKIIDPTSKTTSIPAKPVLITAAHVLRGMPGDYADLDMRVQEGEIWTETKVPIHIRLKGKPLWVEHPAADVAVMWITDRRVLEHLIGPLVPTDWLVTDTWLKSYQIHPGDEVTCLGYPEAITSQFGFPILRTGRIASFPILPTLTSRPLYIDFPVYPGNSGGPVYINSGGVRGNSLSVQGGPKIIGLVTMKQFAYAPNAVANGPMTGSEEQKATDMHLAILEPSSVITEALTLLPR